MLSLTHEIWALCASVTWLFKLSPLVGIFVWNVTQILMYLNPCTMVQSLNLGRYLSDMLSPGKSVLGAHCLFLLIILPMKTNVKSLYSWQNTFCPNCRYGSSTCWAASLFVPPHFQPWEAVRPWKQFLLPEVIETTVNLVIFLRQALGIFRGGNCFKWCTQKV